MGGLLIDTGRRHTVPELMQALESVPVGMIVNTHRHEDHIAGNALLQSKRKVDIRDHPLPLPVSFIVHPPSTAGRDK